MPSLKRYETSLTKSEWTAFKLHLKKWYRKAVRLYRWSVFFSERYTHSECVEIAEAWRESQ